MEWIEAISKLWPLGLVVFLIVFIVLFREGIRNLLERLSKLRLKRGQTEVAAELDTTHRSDVADKAAQSQLAEITASEEEPTTESTEEPQRVAPRTADDWEKQMFAAFLAHDMEGMEEPFAKAQEAEADAVKKLKDEAFYLWLRFDLGDRTALDELQDLAQREGIDSIVRRVTLRYMGYCYDGVGDFGKAVDKYEAAACHSETDVDRASDTVSIATCLYKMGEKSEALNRIMNEVGKGPDDQALSNLYKGLASLYELSKDMEFRAFALEKALQLNPNDTELRFRAGYSYAQKKRHTLALLHYKTLLEFEPEHAMTLNNLGVTCERLGMPIRSVASYKKSTDQSETLAAANLAYQYLYAGFEDEASAVLDKAKQKPKAHPNVGRAFAAISDRKEEETREEASTLDKAREQQRFFLTFAEAYFTSKPELPQFSGIWESTEGNVAEAEISENMLEINWESNSTKYKFAGTVSNRASRGAFFKEQYVLAKGKVDFDKEGDGYAYLTLDGHQLHIMTVKEHDHSLIEFTKK